jgi:tetrapyrrole methylase family protein/MazG family protein
VKQYTYEDFLEIVKTLRSENGCPWAREQTHLSLRSGMMEEAAEVCAAIRLQAQTGEDWNLVEELGDVLLQVVMHAQIAQEEGRFTMEDVVQGIGEKMVRRHPHVFGKVIVKDTDEVLDNWEEIKKNEKKGTGDEAALPLHQIPLELPSLTRAVKVLKKADKVYERQESYAESILSLRQAVQELERHIPLDSEEQHPSKEAEEQRSFEKAEEQHPSNKVVKQYPLKGDVDSLSREVGNILMAISNISRILKISPEQILTDRVDEVIRVYESERKEDIY